MGYVESVPAIGLRPISEYMILRELSCPGGHPKGMNMVLFRDTAIFSMNTQSLRFSVRVIFQMEIISHSSRQEKRKEVRLIHVPFMGSK